MAQLRSEPGSQPGPHQPVSEVLDSRQAGGMLLRGGVLRFGSYVGMVGLSVLSAALLARHLGWARFGQYTTVMSLTAMVANITDAGMSNLGTREYSVLEGDARQALMRDLLGLRVALTLIGVLLAATFAVAAGYDQALLVGTVAAGIGTVAIVFQHTLSIPLSSTLRLGVLSLLDFSRQALSVAAIVALVLAGAGVLPFLVVPLAVNALLILPTAALVQGRISTRMRLRPAGWAALLKQAVSFSLATAVGTMYIFTVQVLTSLVASLHQSGLFAVSFRVFIVVGAVPGLLVSAALPVLARAARDDRERLAYALQRIFEVCLVAGLASAIGLVVGARFVIDVVGGPAYHNAVPVLRIQAIALIATFVLAGWTFGLLSLGRHRALLVTNLTALAIGIGLTIVLVSADGAQGAAIATVAGEATLAAATLRALTRKSPELRPRLARAWRAVLAALPALAIGLIPGVPSAVAAVCSLAAFGVLVLALRALPEEAIEILPRPIRTVAR